MSNQDLNEMSLEDLKGLRRQLEKAIASYETRKLAEARAVLEDKARELGVSLDAVLGQKGKASASSVPAKYRHPENPSLTWTGRGRNPKWIAEHEAKGGSREDFRIS